MKTTAIFKTCGAVLVAASLAILAPIQYYQWRNHQIASAQSPSVIKSASLPKSPLLVSGRPVRIDIPSVHISLAIIDGFYNPRNGTWTLTLDKAQYATVTVQPNNLSGNTLIYGHYRPQVFAYLHHIQPGAEATITTDNGYLFSYSYQTSQAFDATDTSIFNYQGVPRLTVQTCSGSFMEHRQMYYFTYSSFHKLS